MSPIAALDGLFAIQAIGRFICAVWVTLPPLAR